MCKTGNTFIIHIPKCPKCGKEIHQKSKIILYGNEARHSVVCMICREEYKIEYDELVEGPIDFLEDFHGSQYQKDKKN